MPVMCVQSYWLWNKVVNKKETSSKFQCDFHYVLSSAIETTDTVDRVSQINKAQIQQNYRMRRNAVRDSVRPQDAAVKTE